MTGCTFAAMISCDCDGVLSSGNQHAFTDMPVCIAIHPDGLPCRFQASDKSRWCTLHEEGQAKTLKAYKRYSGALSAFDDSLLCNKAALADCESLEQLQAWGIAAREKWALAERVIHARNAHHNRYCRGGDAGHQLFVQTLEDMKKQLEGQMALLDQAAYELVLRQQEASWLLAEHDDPDDGRCDEEDLDETTSIVSEPLLSPKLSTRRSSSVSSQSSISSTPEDPATDEAPAPKAELKTPLSLRELLLNRLTSHFVDAVDPAAECRSKRLCVVDNLFRFVIARTPTLLVKAQSLEQCSPSQFIQRIDLTVTDLQTLEKGLRFGAGGLLSPHVLRNAITSIDREFVDGEDRVIVLSGCWWRKPVKRPMTINEWQLFHEYVHCSGCALKVTKTLAEWMLWRSESHGTGRLPHYADTSATFCDSQLSQQGVAMMRCSDDAKRTLERIQPKSRKMKPVFVEHDTRVWVYIRISNAQERSSGIIAALQSDARFDTLLSSDKDKRPWTTRLRSGSSPAARKAARFTEDRHFCQPHAFEVLSGGRFPNESVDVIVLSAKALEGEKVAAFSETVAKVIEAALVQSSDGCLC